MRHLPTLGTTIALFAAITLAGAQDSQAESCRRSVQASLRSLTATRAGEPVKLDGIDDDAAWRATEPCSDFRTFSPHEDGEPTFRTELRAAYDDRALYIFVRAFDPRPDSVVRLLSRRDTHGSPNDEVQLFIDSFNDRRSGFEYIVNAAGVKSDYLLFDDTGFDGSWDGVWEAATRVDSLGWTAEFAIPLQQLRFTNREAPVFGLMLWRLVGRTGERVSWPVYRPSRSGYVSQTGRLEGIRNLDRPVGFEATPYTLARTRNSVSGVPADGGVRTQLSLGGDLRYLPKPNVSVDATFNPDFGQVESDPAVLDLSGFEVFQAERRPFFLEGAGQFNLPLSNDGSAVLFHSRRIGRSPVLAPFAGSGDAPTETTILGAAKLTARLSPATSLVALTALTSEERNASGPNGDRSVAEPSARFAVTRLQHDFRSGRSGLGLMITHVDRSLNDSASAAMLPRSAQAAALTTQHQTSDGNYRLSGWLGVSEVKGSAPAIAALQLSNVHGFQQPHNGAHFDPMRTELRGAAGQLFVGKVAGGITRFDASYRRISPEFDVNEVGFLTKAGLQSIAANVGVRATRAGRLTNVSYRNASLILGFAGDWTAAGLPLGSGVSLTGAMQFANLMQLRSAVSLQLPGAFCTMSCTRGGPALVDPPRTRGTVDLTGDPRRRAVPRVGIDWYRDDEGRSHGAEGRVEVLWRARSNLDLSATLNAAEAEQDAFFYRRFGALLSDTAHVTVARLDQPVRSITTRLDYTLTTSLSVQWYMQAYVSRGSYSIIRELADPRAKRTRTAFVCTAIRASRIILPAPTSVSSGRTLWCAGNIVLVQRSSWSGRRDATSIHPSRGISGLVPT